MNKREVAKLITRIENGSEWEVEAILKKVKKEKTIFAGITGSAGSGKSTAINALTKEFLKRGKKIGVVAVDPSSPLSGGAILGDRIRMNGGVDDRVFFRSVATRGMKSISKSTGAIARVLSSYGCDVIFIETVGSGQEDFEIAAISDLALLVLNPGMGDSIQMIKSGIIEIADGFVLNKSDMNACLLTYNLLRENFPEKQIFKTISTENKGIKEVADFIESWKGNSREKKRKITEKLLSSLVKDRMFEDALKKGDLREKYEKLINEMVDGKMDLYEALLEMKNLM